jgi:hypothetical protein
MERAQCFTDKTLDPVALHRFANPLASNHRVAILRRITLVREDAHHERAISERFATRPDLAYFRLSPQSQSPFHGQADSQ